jgi:hypothetical protein
MIFLSDERGGEDGGREQHANGDGGEDHRGAGRGGLAGGRHGKIAIAAPTKIQPLGKIHATWKAATRQLARAGAWFVVM